MNQQYQPPDHLQPATADWWIRTCEFFVLEPHHVRLLTLAATSWDRAEQARQILEEKGLVYEDRFGQPRSRPEIAVERDSRTGFMRALRELGLDHVEPPDPRPPRLGGQRH
jgi:phage terminase small subunit